MAKRDHLAEFNFLTTVWTQERDDYDERVAAYIAEETKLQLRNSHICDESCLNDRTAHDTIFGRGLIISDCRVPPNGWFAPHAVFGPHTCTDSNPCDTRPSQDVMAKVDHHCDCLYCQGETKAGGGCACAFCLHREATS